MSGEDIERRPSPSRRWRFPTLWHIAISLTIVVASLVGARLSQGEPGFLLSLSLSSLFLSAGFVMLVTVSTLGHLVFDPYGFGGRYRIEDHPIFGRFILVEFRRRSGNR